MKQFTTKIELEKTLDRRYNELLSQKYPKMSECEKMLHYNDGDITKQIVSEWIDEGYEMNNLTANCEKYAVMVIENGEMHIYTNAN